MNTENLETTSWRMGPHLISSSMQVTPKLMRLTWEGYPLHKVKDHGWGFLIPGRAESVMDSNDDDAVPPIEKIQQMCPAAPERGDLAESVEKKISKRDFYRSKKAHSQTENSFYKGAGLPCPRVDIPGVWFHRLPHPGGTHLNVNIYFNTEFSSVDGKNNCFDKQNNHFF
jgi:DNA polymerase gamma 1